MSSVRTWSRPIAMAILPALLTWSCVFKWDAIKPTELPKANNMPKTPTEVSQKVGNYTTYSSVMVPTGKFERPDGRIIEVTGNVNARIKSRGKVLYFDHPILAKVEGKQLVVQSKNRGRTVFNLQDIQAVELRQVSGWLAFWIITGSLLAGALSAAIVVPISLMK